jgi:DNA-binding transcriptional ArsR family regulator
MVMGTTLQVIAEPRRQAILDLLRDGELPVGELAGRLGLSQPLVSKHLRVLKDAGLVQVRGDAQRRLYRIRPEPLAELDAWLAPYRELWSASLLVSVAVTLAFRPVNGCPWGILAAWLTCPAAGR